MKYKKYPKELINILCINKQNLVLINNYEKRRYTWIIKEKIL